MVKVIIKKMASMRTETKVDSSAVWEVARRIVTMSGTLANHNPLLLSDKVKKVMKVCGNEVGHMLALEKHSLSIIR